MKRFVRVAALLFAMSSLAAPALAADAKAEAKPKTDAKIAKLCAEAKPQFMKTLEMLVNMDSGSDDKEGLAAKQAVLMKMFKDLGGEVTAIPTRAPHEGFNSVMATWKGKGKAKILLLNHYDTVWPKGEAAKRPFRVDEKGVARGPGVYDSQSNLAAMQAVMDMLINKLKTRDFAVITLLCNPDEEIFNPGSQALIKEVAARHDVAYSMDGGGPGGGRLTVSCRGIGKAILTVKGVESHSGGAPEKGRNAGYELAHQILQLRDLSDKEKNTNLNWNMGSFGSKINVIAGSAKAEADVRVADTAEYDRIEKVANERIKNKLIPDCEVTFTLQRFSPPFAPNKKTDDLFAKIAALYKNEMGKDLSAFRSQSTMESTFTSQVTTAIDAFGVGGTGPHSLKEGVEVSNIEPRLYLIVRTLQETMKGNMLPIGTR